ncbi:hypothetical protein EXIGLDRAFT_716124 [Exidia glandulosa HHB12029]|uniref:BRCT domain-containing protein n=1 Tax=Exidia glandulosa HHB12029 TaxID=1314781 RepID=A0A165QVA8_EXIGL|nr:hypothetical protein EXIGLDRAFT_716124 [Exidia glandulosa HHB12029]
MPADATQPSSSSSSRPAPYPSSSQRQNRAYYPGRNSKTANLLSTLNDAQNPITHSDIYKRTDHVATTANRGHQVRDGGTAARKSQWVPFIDAKRRDAVPETQATSTVFRSCKVFIADTADIETRQLVQDGGGRVLNYAAGATHIVSVFPWKSTARKAKESRTKAAVQHVVKPAWVKACVDAGRRKPERPYSV